MCSRGFSARSSQINDDGSIDQTLMQSMEQKLDCLSVCQHIWNFSTATNDDAGDGTITPLLLNQGLMDHREKDTTAWFEDLHGKC
ncbi:hypothetical protein HID58_006788, partial [Brassica napus]